MDRHRDGSVTEENAKLPRGIACQIFYAEGTQREIAARFGVTQRTVGRIKRGETLYSKDLVAVEEGKRHYPHTE